VLGRFLEGFLTGTVVTLVLTIALPAIIVACYRRCKRRGSARYHELQPMGLSGNTYSESMPLPKDELSLTGRAVLDATQFQDKWSKLPVCNEYQTVLTTEGDIEKLMSDVRILCIASGAVGGQMKYYFYAQDTSEGIYLIEVFVGSKDRDLKATFKADSAARVPRLVEVFKETLRPLCRR